MYHNEVSLLCTSLVQCYSHGKVVQRMIVMRDFLLVDLHHPHAVLVRSDLTADSRGDDNLQIFVKSASISV